MYNALVKNVPGKSSTEGGQVRLGRKVLVQNLAVIPARWTILFRGARISNTADIGELMCSATDPITIYKGFLSPTTVKEAGAFNIFVKTLVGNFFSLETHPEETVEEVKSKIEEKALTPAHLQRLVFAGKQIEDGRTMGDYRISKDSTIHVVIRLRGGGGGFFTQDIESKQLSGVCGFTSKHWKGYSDGMNIYGVCPNSKCQSRRSGKPEQVAFKAGYGTILLTPERATFRCPACEVTTGECEDDPGLFPVSRFVLASGRALFRFKKSGVGNETKTLIMESLGNVQEYKTFDQKDGKCEYDFIEITTVGPEVSFYYCVKCDLRICGKWSEVVLKCGHAYHHSCAPSAKEPHPDCLACEAKSFDSFYDMLGFDTKSGQAKAAFVSNKV